MNHQSDDAPRIPLPEGAIDLSLGGYGLENHPLIKNRYFYPLPLRLKQSVIKVLGAGSFTEDELNLETTTSAVVGDCALEVGFLDGAPIPYQGLAESESLNFDYQTAKALGIARGNKAKFEAELEQLNEWLKWNETNHRAYRGWLMTNPEFLEEHEALLDKWMPFVAQIGFRKFGVGLWSATEESKTELPEGTEKLQECDQDFYAFLQRWRLQALVAPYLPEVAAVSLTYGSQFPKRFLPATGSVYLAVPDIAPIPPADLLRPALQRARHPSAESVHLKEWHKLVLIETKREKQFQLYIRRFVLQHFWRAFMSRHEEKTKGKLGKLREVFAQYLGIEAASLNRWMVELRKELGDHWHRRGQKFLSIE
ncbi:MAG: hypothetical protein ACKO0N_06770 [Planctomycetota bacterium]